MTVAVPFVGPVPRTALRLASAVWVAGCVASAAAALYHADRNHDVIRDAFTSGAHAYQARVAERLRTYEYGLRGARGAVLGATVDGLSHEIFRVYSESRDIDQEFPGARGFGFIRRVPRAARDLFLTAAAADRGGAFSHTVLEAPADEHWIIQYIEPEYRNGPAIGLDIASEPRRYAAAHAAMRTGRPQITAPMTLVQATGQPYQGFLLLLPVYAPGHPLDTDLDRIAATRGWAYAPLVLTEVLDGIVEDFPNLMASISDETDAASVPILTPGQHRRAVPGHQLHLELPVYGRTWGMALQPDLRMVGGLRLLSPWATLLGGSLLSLLLAALTFAIRMPAARRAQLAHESEALSRGVINASPQAIVVVDGNGCIVQANARVKEILGHAPAQLQGQTIEMLIPASVRLRHQHLRGGYDQSVRRMGARQDLYALHANGHEFPVEVMLSPLRLGARQLVVASIVDVSEQRAALERLRDSEARWRQLANSMPQLIWACQPDGTCDFLSAQWARYTGIEAPSTFNASWLQQMREQVHEDDRARLEARWQAALQADSPFRAEFRLRRHDGCDRWFDSQAIPLHDAEGRITRWFGSNTDIDARKNAEAALLDLNRTLESRVTERTELLESARRDLRTILDTMPAMVAYWDHDQINRFANHAYRDWFNVDPEQLPGTHIRDLLGPTLYGDNRGHIEAALAGQVQQFERQIGGYHSLVRYIPDRDGDTVRGFYAFVTDVSEIRRATDAAQASNAAKSAFLANMSHEIRTPMNAVLNVAYLLQQTELTGSQIALVETLGAAGRSLMGVINDILDLSKIEAGEMQLTHTPLSMSAVISDAMDIAVPLAARKGLSCTVRRADRLPDALMGDPLRLTQVLNNLLGNAVKFTHQGGITLSVSLRAPIGHRAALRIEVRDTGIGIDPAVQKTLFQPFKQADDTITRRFGGTGLGLAIVQRLVDLMGGTVGVDSQPGIGSAFWVEVDLPVHNDNQTDANPARQPRAPDPLPAPVNLKLPGQRVLVVDDNEINRDIAERILALAGAVVLKDVDGAAAVQRLQNQPDSVDAVLMDIQMPIMDGLEATRCIRQIPGLGNLPIIAITADVLMTERQRALDAGMNDFVTKPFEPARLIARLQALLRLTTASRPAPTTSLGPDTTLLTVFDVDAALLRTGSDGQLLDQLLQRFIAQCRSSAHHDKSPEVVRQRAHALRGAAANVGAARVASTATRLEQAARDANPPEMAAAAQAVGQAINEFIPIAEQWRQGWVAVASGPSEAGPLTLDTLNQLKQMLRLHQFEALDIADRVTDWSTHLGDAGAAVFINTLRQLDFASALTMLSALQDIREASGAPG